MNITNGLIILAIASVSVVLVCRGDNISLLSNQNITTNANSRIDDGRNVDLHIAIGELVESKLLRRGYGYAIFRVVEWGRGGRDTDQIGVAYYSTSLIGDMPKKAILLLEDGARGGAGPAGFRARGMDAKLGILEYSEERWARIMATATPDLLRTPVSERMEMTAAIKIVERFLKEVAGEQVQHGYRAERSDFGWRVHVWPSPPQFDADATFVVGDDGNLKWVTGRDDLLELLQSFGSDLDGLFTPSAPRPSDAGPSGSDLGPSGGPSGAIRAIRVRAIRVRPRH